ncbi:hypothetical protein AVEN_27434-1 [Araneus ventricosus]|uniref:Uncharacterized protein n=1 Tax=Araneus ventricosus TaxID=182803 RepID=A0A4Y2EJG5_ARAVE|nr:hypothetical protein AVEN_27434-1 [Araneus ventricosus]
MEKPNKQHRREKVSVAFLPGLLSGFSDDEIMKIGIMQIRRKKFPKESKVAMTFGSGNITGMFRKLLWMRSKAGIPHLSITGTTVMVAGTGDRWNLSETGRRTFLFAPQVSINRASFNSRTNQFVTGYGPFVTYLHRFGLCSQDRCVCGAKGDPNHYATVCPVTKPFHLMKPNDENL